MDEDQYQPIPPPTNQISYQTANQTTTEEITPETTHRTTPQTTHQPRWYSLLIFWCCLQKRGDAWYQKNRCVHGLYAIGLLLVLVGIAVGITFLIIYLLGLLVQYITLTKNDTFSFDILINFGMGTFGMVILATSILGLYTICYLIVETYSCCSTTCVSCSECCQECRKDYLDAQTTGEYTEL